MTLHYIHEFIITSKASFSGSLATRDLQLQLVRNTDKHILKNTIPDDNTEPRPIQRTRYRGYQLELLEGEFSRNPRPSWDVIEELARETGLTEGQVRVCGRMQAIARRTHVTVNYSTTRT
ncbi:uncharacterized protein LOC112574976 [Pomacea canaliculata]|uniref:uncharacterized protein LOC112574976 n=1 Tax=Pomacea canaliculata TaxID=400727 RepID=UPI000D735AE6|nr:uncharacterized protein LOC112574976 [Pomacea canaliculata]